MRTPALMFAIALACATGAEAQVNKCVNAQGKISYSATPCSLGQRGGQVLGREATEPVDDPYARERNMESLRRTAAQNRGDYGAGIAPPAPGGPVLLDNDPNARIDAQSERNMNKRLAELEVERSRKAQRDADRADRRARGPGNFVGCDQAGCWGSANNVRYTFVAGGNLSGTDGSMCVRGAGNTFSCN